MLIDNSEEGEVHFALRKNYKWIEKKIKMSAANKRPLLFFLDEFIRNNRCALNRLRGIAVVVGLGRFTSTRIAVTTANTLAFAFKIPVIGVKGRDLALAEKRLKSARPGMYLSATYSGEAHIGGRNK